ncbi:hypothetical protein HHI36_017701 [Cryptolaemus montrouzieri]|uniref:Uncharacterized protein n=1 Tax=Cryptolaemus montrouzieri TaxID=559131 RepID=A0ABD2NNB0_9CUCU
MLEKISSYSEDSNIPYHKCCKDQYLRDLSKGNESTTDSKEFIISGPQQTRSTEFAKELKNIKLKEALVKFLIDHWADDEMAPIIGKKTIYLNHDLCYVYSATENTVTRTINHDLSCQDHEEADTK